MIVCIANNGSNGEPEIPLWECPCAECTKMDWDACDDETRSDYRGLADWRHLNFPKYWDAKGRGIAS